MVHMAVVVGGYTGTTAVIGFVADGWTEFSLNCLDSAPGEVQGAKSRVHNCVGLNRLGFPNRWVLMMLVGLEASIDGPPPLTIKPIYFQSAARACAVVGSTPCGHGAPWSVG